MKNAFANLNKLKGRSLDEIKVRAAQALAAYLERRGWSRQSRLPSSAGLMRLLDAARFEDRPASAEGLQKHFRRRTSPRFFAGFEDRTATQHELDRKFRTGKESLIKKADRIVEGRFPLLGFGDLYFGEPIDWHLEPLSNKHSPLLHWSRIDEVDASETGDKKIIWELNRHQHFLTLGRAYFLTGDERYSRAFAAQLAGWMDDNPPKLGLNWISALEVSFRAISWLWALHFFRDSSLLTPALFERALKFLYLHARHVETYLSTYSSPNTHLTGEALGLFYLGTLLPEFREARRWRDTGCRILLTELERHVLPDGVYFERATYYHRYTTDFYMHFLILAERNGETVAAGLTEKVQGLLDHLMHITRPDGTTPFIGDDDGGRLVMLDERQPRDFRAALSTGAVLFSRPDYKYVAGTAAEETLWLLGCEGLRGLDELDSRQPEEQSRAFPDGGYYVMRDGWTADSNYLLVDCGPHGALSCGHAHADALSFELVARGHTLLVDPGTYTYTGSKELRDYFRSSSAHNTLTIDGESSSVPGGPFKWKESAHASTIAWKSAPRFDYFNGSHDGYLRLKPEPAIHTRSLLFLKDGYWIIRDCVEVMGTHRSEVHFHFAADAHPSLKESRDDHFLEELPSEAPGLQVFSFGDGGEWRMENGWVSSCYGARTPAHVYNFSQSGNGPQEFFSFLIPRRAQEPLARVREIETLGGRAFEITCDGWRDVLLVGGRELVETERIASDFKWTWARFAADQETLEELVLIGGRHVQLGRHAILDLPQCADYVVARRLGDKLFVEIDGRLLDVPLPLHDLEVTSAGAHPNQKS